MEIPTASGDATASHFRPDIEGLRALAVLFVVAFHAQLAGARSGYIGVDVFFVLSGYLITGLLSRELGASGSIDLRRFYARRFLRLLPAAGLVLVVTIGAQQFLFGPMERVVPSLSAIAAALYASNIYFARSALNYFAPQAEFAPLLHYWSLAVEEQFYLIWPWIIGGAFRLGGKPSRLTIVLVSCTLASLAACVWLTSHVQPWAYFGMPARAWEFAIGGLASQLPTRVLLALRPHRAVLGWAGGTAIVASGGLIPHGITFPGLWPLAAVLGTAALLVSGGLGTSTPIQMLGSRIPRWIGRQSYSWYLWHWPVLALAAPVVELYDWRTRLLLSVGALVLAAITTALVERPLRFNSVLRTRPDRTLALAGALTAVCVAVGYASYRDAMAKGGDLYRVAHERQPIVERRCTGDVEDRVPRACLLGDTSAATTIVLFGDSHATQWSGALSTLAQRHKWRLEVYAKAACPIARVQVYSTNFHREYTECVAWRDSGMKVILSRRPAMVLISQWSRRVSKLRAASGVTVGVTPSEWQEGMRSTLASFDSAGIPVIVFRDSPMMRNDVPTCLSQAALHGTPPTACGRARKLALDEQTLVAEHQAAAGLAHVAFLDMSDDICDRAQCPPLRDGILVYRDDSHLSVRFSAHLTEALGRRLDAAVQRLR